MNISESTKIVVAVITELLDGKLVVTEDMQLVGGDALIDSMKLVEICLSLEDEAEEHGFEFDWTSDAALSRSRSMFRTVATLAQEFSVQSEA